MRRFVPLLSIVLAPLLLTFCTDEGPLAGGSVDIRDDCDSVSFNAGLGAGTCKKNGGTTLSRFNAELTATHAVAAWAFVPSALSIHTGESILAFNSGGERHTFTEVAAFGGGIVPAINALSGTPIVAPECANLKDTDFIPPGVSFDTDIATTVGTEHYQCCIHPWMRANVTVVAR